MRCTGLHIASALAFSSLAASGTAASPSQPALTTVATLERVMVTTPPRVVDDFELLSHEGRPLRLSALRGQPVMLFFGYAHCPDLCPTALSKLRSLKESDPRGLRQLRVVFVSVDGDRDGPDALKAYLRHFSHEFIGLSGAPAEVREIARGLAATVFKGKPAKGSGEYLVEHTNRVYAIDRHGRLRAELYDAPTEVMEQVARVLLKEP
jgi:protein SCO1